MSDIIVNSPVVAPVIITEKSGTNVVVSNSTTAPSTISVKGIFSGTGDSHFVFTQSIPESIWEITHNLGKKPAVTVVDSGDSVVVGEVEYINLNSVRLTFAGAFSGKAYFN